MDESRAAGPAASPRKRWRGVLAVATPVALVLAAGLAWQWRPPLPVAPKPEPVATPVVVPAALPAATDVSDTPEADVPPATIDSPQVRDAWLTRIRELVAAGRDDEARASLVEFQHRYPEFPLPDDLLPNDTQPHE